MNGISIIMAAHADELDTIDGFLDVESVWLSDLPQHHTRDPDTVYRVLMPNREAMSSLASTLNVRRGILLVDGKAEFIGFNRDWMTKTLLWQGKRKEEPKSPPAALWEKDDPWESIGYTR